MKTCFYCKIEKPISEFNRNGKQPNGKLKLKPFCKECESKVVKERQRTVIRTAYSITHKEPFECSICSYSKNFTALEFHHLDPREKEFEIKNMTNCSLDTAIREISKCILVCANCHREIHNPE